MKRILRLIGLCACAAISDGAELSPVARQHESGIHVDAASTKEVIVEANAGFEDD